MVIYIQEESHKGIICCHWEIQPEIKSKSTQGEESRSEGVMSRISFSCTPPLHAPQYLISLCVRSLFLSYSVRHTEPKWVGGVV